MTRDIEKNKAYNKEYRRTHRAERIAYDQAHKEERRVYALEYVERHREEINAKARERRKNNREKALAEDKAYRLSHGDQLAEYNRRYRKENPELYREAARRYYYAHHELVLERARRYRGSNRQEINAKRRAHTKTKKYGLGEGEWEAIFERQGRACAICQSPVPRSNRGWQTDHDHSSNQVRGILCTPCNVALGTIAHPFEWGARARKYIEEPPAGKRN